MIARKSQIQANISNRYGDFKKFAAIFCADNQRSFCRTPERCVCGHAPTFYHIDIAYGRGAAAAVVLPQLFELGEFCGCKDKLNEMQNQQLAQIIVSQFGYLKITELMLFLWWFKSGKYGKFYGAVDPLVVSSALRDFLLDRDSIIESEKARQNARECAQTRQKAVTYEEWLAMRGETPDDHPHLSKLFISGYEEKKDAGGKDETMKDNGSETK